MKIHYLSIGVIFLLGISCIRSGVQHKGKSPEDVVRTFVQLSASAKKSDDRDSLSEFCAGDLRRAFERMTDEAFKLSYIDNDISIKKFEVLSAAIVEQKATVRYKVSIENKAGTQPTLEINEREVDLQEKQGAWFLENIRPYGSDQIAFTRGMIF